MSLVKVHLWSDIPDNTFLGIPRPSAGPSAVGHVTRDRDFRQALGLPPGDNHIVRQVTGLSSLAFVIDELKGNIRVDRLDFHTHGSSGSLALGKESLNYFTLKQFINRGYDTVFAPGARIFFHGCNVADGRWGELFLAAFARIFLKRRGGRVGGSTSKGIMNPLSRYREIYHLWGDTVYAYNDRGRVRLKNHVHLDRQHVQEVRHALENTLAHSIGLNFAKHAAVNQAVSRARLHLTFANLMAVSGAYEGSGNERFEHLNNAHLYLEQAYKEIKSYLRSPLGLSSWLPHACLIAYD